MKLYILFSRACSSFSSSFLRIFEQKSVTSSNNPCKRETPTSPSPPRHNSHTAGDAQVCQPHFNKQVTPVGLSEFSSSSNSSSYFHIEFSNYIVIFLQYFPRSWALKQILSERFRFPVCIVLIQNVCTHRTASRLYTIPPRHFVLGSMSTVGGALATSTYAADSLNLIKNPLSKFLLGLMQKIWPLSFPGNDCWVVTAERLGG